MYDEKDDNALGPDWNKRSNQRNFTKNAQYIKRGKGMEDIGQPLRVLYNWYDGVRDKYRQAQEVAQQLERELDISRGASRALEGYIQDLRQEVEKYQQSLKRAELERDRHKAQLTQVIERIVNTPSALEIDVCEMARRLDIAHARIRVLEQERDEALDELEEYKKDWYDAHYN